jgi:hypothetical protein
VKHATYYLAFEGAPLMSHQVILPITDGSLDLGPGSRCSTRSLTGNGGSGSC